VLRTEHDLIIFDGQYDSPLFCRVKRRVRCEALRCQRGSGTNDCDLNQQSLCVPYDHRCLLRFLFRLWLRSDQERLGAVLECDDPLAI
jgi:hypothetical protein